MKTDGRDTREAVETVENERNIMNEQMTKWESNKSENEKKKRYDWGKKKKVKRLMEVGLKVKWGLKLKNF